MKDPENYRSSGGGATGGSDVVGVGSSEENQQSFFARMITGRLSRGNSMKDPENNRINTVA
jgi:hypothetical protein